MSDENPRSRRVGEQIQRLLANLIRSSIKDPRVGMVTVSAVRVTRDLSYAKVYITVLGDKKETAESLAVLNNAAGYLRKQIGRDLTTRITPQLTFLIDESIEQGAHLSALIDAAVASDKRDPDPSDD